MLQTLNEIGVKPITGKSLSPQIKSLNKIIYLFKNTPLSKNKALMIIELCNKIVTTNQNVDIQLVIKKLKNYCDCFLYSEGDKDVLQRLINYQVVRWIKTKDVNDSLTIIEHLERWDYTRRLVNDSPFANELKMDSFNRLNKEYLNILIERYKL